MRTSLMLKEMNLCLCDGAQTHKAKGTLHLLSPFQKENTRDGIILFDSYHNIYSPYGQPASWHRAKATCPPPQKKEEARNDDNNKKPNDIPPHIIISKSRAAYALNIRLLCMVINPLKRTHASHYSTGTGAYRIFIFIYVCFFFKWILIGHKMKTAVNYKPYASMCSVIHTLHIH